MNRITFIKRLVLGTAAVPAVLAASKATKASLVIRNDCPNTIKNLTDYKPTHASSRRNLYSSVSYPDVIRGKVNNRDDFMGGVQLLKPEDAPLYRSI